MEIEKIPPKAQEVLLKIYIGQNIRPEGILQKDIQETKEVQYLLSKGLIKENHWYLDQFLTTEKGSQIASNLIRKRLEEKRRELEIKVREIPKKVISFIIKNPGYYSNKLLFSTLKLRYWSERAEDKILNDSRIWILRDSFFSILQELGLCVKTHFYVSTRGGEIRELCYVLSSEVLNFLLENFSTVEFTPEERKLLDIYSFLMSVIRVLDSEDLDFVRQRYYELLKLYSLSEEEVAAFIDETSKKRITSDYRGLLSEGKPFEIKNSTSFKIYLDKAILEPIIRSLLGKREKVKQFITTKRFPSLEETKAELGLLNSEQLGQFYLMVSRFEQELRQFLKLKLGKGWLKILRNEFPKMVDRWEKLKKRDERLGIEPEKDLMNYANCEDYIKIIRKHKKIFADNDEDLAMIIAHLKIWYNQGRNPLMHCRTVNMQKFFTTKSAIRFLEQWMKRKSL